MKRGLIMLSLLVISVCLRAQSSLSSTPADTIVKLNGSLIAGDITKISSSYINFKLLDNPEQYTIERKEVHKIIYKTGRIEVLNQAAFQLLDEGMWEAVWITEDQADVASLYLLGEIEATSPSSARSASAAKKGATIKAQKKAANMSGTIILVTKKQNTGGFGEYPGYILKGFVYGPEPPGYTQADNENASN